MRMSYTVKVAFVLVGLLGVAERGEAQGKIGNMSDVTGYAPWSYGSFQPSSSTTTDGNTDISTVTPGTDGTPVLSGGRLYRQAIKDAKTAAVLGRNRPATKAFFAAAMLENGTAPSGWLPGASSAVESAVFATFQAAVKTPTIANVNAAIDAFNAALPLVTGASDTPGRQILSTVSNVLEALTSAWLETNGAVMK